MADSVRVSLEIATQAAEIALKNLKKTTEDSNNTFNIFKGNFAAGLALDGIKTAYNAIAGTFETMIHEASEFEIAVNKMNVALKASGQYSTNTSKELLDFAGHLQEITVFGDEAVLASSSLLLSLTNLSVKGIKQATMASADLASTLNIDLQTATEMIAKAVNGNTMAFGKLGIEIKKGHTDTENLANVLEALSKQQGAAEAQTKTYAGAMAQLDNAKGDLLKTIGALITQNPVLVSGINNLTGVIMEAAEWVADANEEIGILCKTLLYSAGVFAAAGVAMAAYQVWTIGLTTSLIALELAAQAAWVAIGGPIVAGAALAIAGVGAAVYILIKYTDELKAEWYDAAAAVLEYAAKAADVFSSDSAKIINEDAKAFRDKSQAIRDNILMQEALAQSEKESQAMKAGNEDDKNETERQKKEYQKYLKNNREILAARQEFNTQLVLADEERDVQLQNQELAHQTAMYEAQGQYNALTVDNLLAKQQELLLVNQEFERDQLNAKIEAERLKASVVEDALAREKALKLAAYKADLDTVKLSNKQQLEQKQLLNKSEETLAKNRVANQRDTFATIATLSTSNNKELAIIGKAAGITQIAIDTPVAISKALAAFPPPFNFAAAALVGAAMAAQASQIAGLTFQNGGIIPGNSFTGDKVVANVNSREMVLNVQQQKRLLDLANGEQVQAKDNSLTNSLLAQLIDAVKGSTSIQIDGREIISVVRNGIQAGRTI